MEMRSTIRNKQAGIRIQTIAGSLNNIAEAHGNFGLRFRVRRYLDRSMAVKLTHLILCDIPSVIGHQEDWHRYILVEALYGA